MTRSFPALSELLSWSTTHLTSAADHWDALAGRWNTSFKAIHQNVRTSAWEGQAYEAAHERTYWDSVRVGHAAGDLRDGARIARHGASDVSAAQSRLRDAVSMAQDAGFHVGDKYTVTDRETPSSQAQQAQRQAQAEALAEDIRWRAAALVDTDQHVGTRLSEAIGRLGDLALEEHAQHSGYGSEAQGRNGVHFVNLFGPKESPILEPGVPDDPVGRGGGPSSADIRGVLEKLPQGDRPWIREVRTSEDLQRLWKWLEQNGVDNPSRYGDLSKGVWKELPDGTGVGRRASAGSTKAPVVDINLNGTDHWKVHINPQTGGVPDIPALRPAVGEESARVPATNAIPPAVVEPPAEPKAPPVRGGPLGGVPVGGPLPDGAMPYLVDPPGPDAGGPDLPVIGDGIPDGPRRDR